MKIKLELFGASRDFSEKDHLEVEVKDKASIKDLRDEIIQYLDKNFKGNKSFIKIAKSSYLSSEFGCLNPFFAIFSSFLEIAAKITPLSFNRFKYF